MIPLILFNLYLTSNSYFLAPQANDKYYINSPINITWLDNVNDNITDLFLTHSNPPIISTYGRDEIIYHKTLSNTRTRTNNLQIMTDIWTPYNVLNMYETESIQWRFMLSNTSTPHLGSISNNKNIVILSKYFFIKSDKNVTIMNTSCRFDSNIFIDINGFKFPYIVDVLIGGYADYQEIGTINIIDTSTIITDNSLSVSTSTETDLEITLNSGYIYDYNILKYSDLFIKITDTNGISRQSNKVSLEFIYTSIIHKSNDYIDIETICNPDDSTCVHDLYIVISDTGVLVTKIKNIDSDTYSIDTTQFDGNYTIYTKLVNKDIQSNPNFINIVKTTTTTTSNTVTTKSRTATTTSRTATTTSRTATTTSRTATTTSRTITTTSNTESKIELITNTITATTESKNSTIITATATTNTIIVTSTTDGPNTKELDTTTTSSKTLTKDKSKNSYINGNNSKSNSNSSLDNNTCINCGNNSDDDKLIVIIIVILLLCLLLLACIIYYYYYYYKRNSLCETQIMPEYERHRKQIVLANTTYEESNDCDLSGKRDSISSLSDIASQSANANDEFQTQSHPRLNVNATYVSSDQIPNYIGESQNRHTNRHSNMYQTTNIPIDTNTNNIGEAAIITQNEYNHLKPECQTNNMDNSTNQSAISIDNTCNSLQRTETARNKSNLNVDTQQHIRSNSFNNELKQKLRLRLEGNVNYGAQDNLNHVF